MLHIDFGMGDYCDLTEHIIFYERNHMAVYSQRQALRFSLLLCSHIHAHLVSSISTREIIGKSAGQTGITADRWETLMTQNNTNDASAQVAWQPEDCNRLLLAALESGDIDTSVALYEPGAALFSRSSKAMIGQEAIRANNAGLIALKPRFHIERIVTTFNGDGTIATTRMKARLEGTRTDGRSVTTELHSLEVLRRQSDGSWRYVIDDPFGSMRAQMEDAVG